MCEDVSHGGQCIQPNLFIVNGSITQPLTLLPLLAQADASGLFKNISYAVLGLFIVIVVGWLSISKIRAWMREDSGTSETFTLEDLRRLHRAGQMTDAEFARAQEAMIGSVRATPPKAPSQVAAPKRQLTAKQSAALAKLGSVGLNKHLVDAVQREIAADTTPAAADPRAPLTPPLTPPMTPIPPSRIIRPNNASTTPAPPIVSVDPVQPDPLRVVIRPIPLQGSPEQILPKDRVKRPPGLS